MVILRKLVISSRSPRSIPPTRDSIQGPEVAGAICCLAVMMVVCGRNCMRGSDPGQGTGRHALLILSFPGMRGMGSEVPPTLPSAGSSRTRKNERKEPRYEDPGRRRERLLMNIVVSWQYSSGRRAGSPTVYHWYHGQDLLLIDARGAAGILPPGEHSAGNRGNWSFLSLQSTAGQTESHDP